MSKLYTEAQVKLIATRFARQARMNGDIVTSNDTINLFEKFIENFDTGATTDEISIRVGERQRAMNICKSFIDEYADAYESKLHAEKIVYAGKSHNSIAFVDRERSEIARYCMNAISGRTGLNSTESLEEIIKKYDN